MQGSGVARSITLCVTGWSMRGLAFATVRYGGCSWTLGFTFRSLISDFVEIGGQSGQLTRGAAESASRGAEPEDLLQSLSGRWLIR